MGDHITWCTGTLAPADRIALLAHLEAQRIDGEPYVTWVGNVVACSTRVKASETAGFELALVLDGFKPQWPFLIAIIRDRSGVTLYKLTRDGDLEEIGELNAPGWGD